jgi:hypothetical protein
VNDVGDDEIEAITKVDDEHIKAASTTATTMDIQSPIRWLVPTIIVVHSIIYDRGNDDDKQQIAQSTVRVCCPLGFPLSAAEHKPFKHSFLSSEKKY